MNYINTEKETYTEAELIALLTGAAKPQPKPAEDLTEFMAQQERFCLADALLDHVGQYGTLELALEADDWNMGIIEAQALIDEYLER